MPQEESKEAVPVPSSREGLALLAAVEQRLANANSSHEAILWTQVRGEILRQNSLLGDVEHRRRLEMVHLIFKMGLSVIAFLTGAYLVVAGFSYAGLFILGAALWSIAPGYVRRFLQRRQEDETE